VIGNIFSRRALSGSAPIQRAARRDRARLQEGWVIANHILVSFHVAFISSVLAIPGEAASRAEVLRFIFASNETIVSAAFTYLVFHAAVALHELGHYLEAVRLRALSDSLQEQAAEMLARPPLQRWLHLGRMFLLAPFGLATGIRREGLNYYPDAPYNLAVAAAGPRASRNVAITVLPAAAVLLALGLLADLHAALYGGRLLLGLGVVTGLDFLLADPGKYREFRQREQRASEAAGSLRKTSAWFEAAPAARTRITAGRMQQVTHPRLGAVTAPWQFRNCGMGGRHTEKEYPESNISMQEAMFLVLGAADSQEAQEMTVRLQNRLKEILENAEGCRVMGIGLEGGLAPYVDRGDYPLPEVRLWAMMKQAIEECGYAPGEEVAIALDPALSELEIAYREEFDVPDSVGRYLFWRDHSRRAMDREEVLQIYEEAITRYDIPILSIEDGFSEDDHEGWRILLERLGDRVLVVGDDLVTTNDRTIETAAEKGLINSVLIKANQIGTLYETLLAVLVCLGKGLELVISHRSKSPNDDMEAHIALAANALGLKAGGGANTERLVKYQAVTTQMERARTAQAFEPETPGSATIEGIQAREEPTNAGIPTVGVDAQVALPGAHSGLGVRINFHGATPLGTSAGTGEAVHLVDGVFERSESREVAERHAAWLHEVEPGVMAFNADVTQARVEAARDPELLSLFTRAARYGGKGCLNAVDNVREVVAPFFKGKDLAHWSLLDIDRALLRLELATARQRKKLPGDAAAADEIAVMQRKQNLGMNVILSVSLALARAAAHVRGRELFEYLREEMLLIVERLAAEHGVAIAGSRFDDYVSALRQVNALLESRGLPLHETLRQASGIYLEERPAAAEAAFPVPAEAAPPAPDQPFSDRDAEQLALFNQALRRAWGGDGSEEDRKEVLRSYLQTMTVLGRRYRMFEIANHRIFRNGSDLVVPYNAHGNLSIHVLRADGDETVIQHRVPHGTVIADATIFELAGMRGEAIDLESEIYHLEVDDMPVVRIARLRDLAAVLERLNRCGSRHEAVYLLRFVVARLCSTGSQGLPGAKNLQSEIARVRLELARLLNGPFATRLRLPLRILVRSISDLVSRPKIIDEVWQDTIELSEVRVRGSAIANEIRRSTHHALGQRTLKLARAYLRWLETGSAEFPDPANERPGAQDEAARKDEATLALVSRIVVNLEHLMGSTQVAERISEWRREYSADLLRCESTSTLEEELEALVANGIRARNRWVYQHRLRSFARKARDGPWPEEARRAFEDSLASLQKMMPDAEGFDADTAEETARDAVGAFIGQLRAAHQDRLFQALDDLLDQYGNQAYFEAFKNGSKLRWALDGIVGTGVFLSQNFLLHQLDCLLEEMGYLALRHVASGYEEGEVDIEQCLRIVHVCGGNLERDGMFARELWDLSAMLVDEWRTPPQMVEVLESIQRHYHRLVHRVSVAYEVMAEELGFGPDEMRGVLGNFQRMMHDLNSLVHFADLARKRLAEGNVQVQWSIPKRAAENPWDFVHLSHFDDLEARISNWQTRSLQDRYGGKGSGLMYIAYLGIPTRDAFIIPTTLPRLGLHKSDPARLQREVMKHVRILEADIERNEGAALRLGDPEAPLLLSVRGGSVFSMPGILETVIFVGMTDQVAEALAREDEWYAWDAYRRFIASYADAAWGINLEKLDLVEKAKRRYGVELKTQLPGEAMREVVESSKAAVRAAGHAAELDALLADPELQLHSAVRAVHGSWDRERAVRYRAIKHISDGWHTAAIVQHMASGNRSNPGLEPGMDESRISLTGVIPSTLMQTTGFRVFTGDIKFSASGDDLVGGLTTLKSFEPVQKLKSLAPMLERRLNHVGARLRRFRGTDAEIEFTVERGVLSVLQARSAQPEERTRPRTFDNPGPAASRGIGVSGGAFRGLVAFNERDIARLAAELEDRDRDEVDGVLLLLSNPIPDEIPLILSADALLTAKGGSTSHAAVAIHGIEDKPYSAVLGVSALSVTEEGATLAVEGAEAPHTIRAGDILSIHGKTGEVFTGSRRVLDMAAVANL